MKIKSKQLTKMQQFEYDMESAAIGSFRCKFCQAGQGSPCLSKKGKPRKPHNIRMSAAMVDSMEAGQ